MRLLRIFSLKASTCGLRSRREDKGGATMLVTLFVAGGVFIGMGAFVIDVGHVYSEREQLQSGADAAAIAVARGCGPLDAVCDTDLTNAGTAGKLADANSRDGRSDVARICGRGPGLTPCPEPNTNLTACVGPAPTGGRYVEVATQTRTQDGRTLLPPILAQTLVGNGAHQGTAVEACARVTWGGPTKAKAFGLAMSMCVWKKATNSGQNYAPKPPYRAWVLPPEPASGYERFVYQDNSDCDSEVDATGKKKLDGAGSIAWLGDELPSACNNEYFTGSNVPGRSADNLVAYLLTLNCQGVSFVDWVIDFITKREPIVVPIYDTAVKKGFGKAEYHIVGFASFVPSGYVLNFIWFAPSWRTLRLCSIPIIGTVINPCFTGFFARANFEGEIGEGEDFGLGKVKLIG